MSTSTSACDCLVGVPTGPTLASTCGGSAFMLFMGLLEVFIRSQCDLEDPCGRASSRVSVANSNEDVRASNLILFSFHTYSFVQSQITNTISLSLAVARRALWLRRVSPKCRNGKCCSLKPVSGVVKIDLDKCSTATQANSSCCGAAVQHVACSKHTLPTEAL